MQKELLVLNLLSETIYLKCLYNNNISICNARRPHNKEAERKNMAFILLDESQVEEANAITHGGKFHADDVFSTVLLSKVFKNVRLCRTKNAVKENDAIIVFDVGGGKFDHHQADFCKCRKNGIKYSSFGLLWDVLGGNLELGENAELAEKMFDDTFVSVIDAIDNGQVEKVPNEKFHIVSVSDIIEAFNPNWDDDISENEAFLKAVETATIIFDNAIRNVVSQSKIVSQVENAIEATTNGIMVIDQPFEWEYALFNSSNPKAAEIMYVVSPSSRGGYKVKAVPTELGSFKPRKPFPAEWAGLRGEEIVKATGVTEAIFCHRERFTCSAKTISGAVLLAIMAINK